MLRKIYRLIVLSWPALGACQGGGDGGGPAPLEEPFPDAPRTIRLESPAFGDGGAIPRQYTCDGANVSPPLIWSGAPAEADSLALICDDPDAPRGTFTHWVLVDLAPKVDVELPTNVPKQAVLNVGIGDWAERARPPRQGRNGFGAAGYGGPCPPRGTHRYVFRIFALGAGPPLDLGGDREALLRAMAGRVLAQGRLMGTYTRAR